MKKGYKAIKHEIQNVREQLYSCIEKNGINNDSSLIDISKRLDELILQWMKSNKKQG